MFVGFNPTPLMMQVVQMPQYQQWMAGFGTSTKQVVLNCEAVPSAVTLPSPATLQVSQMHTHAHFMLCTWNSLQSPEIETEHSAVLLASAVGCGADKKACWCADQAELH